jgi:hypothetical protein
MFKICKTISSKILKNIAKARKTPIFNLFKILNKGSISSFCNFQVRASETVSFVSLIFYCETNSYVPRLWNLFKTGLVKQGDLHQYFVKSHFWLRYIHSATNPSIYPPTTFNWPTIFKLNYFGRQFKAF